MNNQTLKIYVFFCSTSLDQGLLADICSGAAGITVKTISLPCSGKVDVSYLIKAFETGADGRLFHRKWYNRIRKSAPCQPQNVKTA